MVVDRTKIDPFSESINTEADQFLASQIYESNNTRDEDEPVDRFGLIYFVMLLQGAGVLLPWNAFISAPDYFNSLYGDSTVLYFGIANSIPNLLGLLFLIKFGSKLPLFVRVVPPFAISFLILVTVPILGFCKVYGLAGFITTMTLVVLVALCTASLQGGIYGFAGTLPPMYMQAVMSGNGLAGIITSVIRVITKLTLERVKKGERVPLSTMTLSAAIYFFVSAFVIFMCIVTYLLIRNAPFVKYHQAKAQSISDEDIIEDEDLPLNSSAPQASALVVFGKIYNLCLLVAFIFFVTLAIFPGISVTIQTHYPGTFMEEWLSIFMVVLFNLGDFAGRTAPRFIVLFNEKWIGFPIISRVIFLPLFILCIYPRVITFDFFPMIFMFLMALTNGYLCSNIMMLAPGVVKPYEREIASTMMTFFLLLGICLGSNCGLLIGKVVGL